MGWETKASMKGAVTGEGVIFTLTLFWKASGYSCEADLCHHRDQALLAPLHLCSTHQLSFRWVPWNSSRLCPSQICSLWPHTCPGVHILPRLEKPTGQRSEGPWATYQLPLATRSNTHHFHTDHCLGLFPSRASPERGSSPIVARPFIHPCPGTGVSYPPPAQHKQVPAVLIHMEWCMILGSKCAYEPHKSSTTFEWTPYIYPYILSDSKWWKASWNRIHLAPPWRQGGNG